MSKMLCVALALLLVFPVGAFAGFAGTDIFLPAAGRVAGAGGSQFYTTVWVSNPSPDIVDVQITFFAAGQRTCGCATHQPTSFSSRYEVARGFSPTKATADRTGTAGSASRRTGCGRILPGDGL